MALSALGFQLQSDKSIMKSCWAALRQNKENEKLTFLTDKLSNEVEPGLMSVNKDLKAIGDKKTL